LAASVRRPRHCALFPAAVDNVLVDASTMLDARTTAASLASMHAGSTVRIHLLAISQPPTGYAGSHLRGVDLKRVRDEEARGVLAPLAAALDASGTPYRAHVQFGPWLETIARHVRDLGCRRVVVGSNPNRLFSNALLRHDRWRIASFLRRSRLEARVTCVDEPAVRKGTVVPGAVAHHP
jgi:hypothetical protein